MEEWCACAAVAMLTRECAVVLADELGDLLRDGDHAIAVVRISRIEERADVEATHRGVCEECCGGVVVGTDFLEALDEGWEFFGSYGCVLDEGEGDALAWLVVEEWLACFAERPGARGWLLVAVDLYGRVREQGAELVEAKGADSCCGFGGTFSVKYPEVSVAMLDWKLQHLEQAEVDVIVSGDVSCLMQIGGRLERRKSGVKTMHLAEVLAAR